MKILIIVPARAGSVGIKNKNLIKIYGKHLIEYTLDFIKKTKMKNVLISSDSKKILNLCKLKGFSVEYLRPKNLSKSNTSMYTTVNHGIEWLKKKNKNFDTLLLLQPSNPLRKLKTLKQMIIKMKSKNYNSVVSVTKMREHPSECVEIKPNNQWKYLTRNNNYSRRQEFINNFYFIDGDFFLINIKLLKKFKKFIIPNHTCFVKSDKLWPVDIDYPDDLKVLKSFLKK